MYSEKVLEEFKNPKNVGAVENPNAVSIVGNPVCGDEMKITMKIKNNIIQDIKVETFGCVSAIASSSKATEMVKGKTIEKALALTKEKVAEELDGLPPLKMHCSVLAVQGIHEAIKKYKEKKIKK